MNSKNKGFTLIELLVVILIIAILAAVITSILNPQELERRARDATRLSDLASLNSAINGVISETGSTSLPMSQILCVPPQTGPSCFGNSTDSGARATDGTGWIKIKFSGYPVINIPTLPKDPLNNSQYFYAYNSDGSKWEIAARLESQKYRPLMDQTSLLYSVGTSTSLIASNQYPVPIIPGPSSSLPAFAENWTSSPECNPGGGTSCPCDASDLALINHPDYNEIVGNVTARHTWINALATVKNWVMPDNSPLRPAVFTYSGQFQIPVVPKPDVSQQQNAQVDHFMIQFYDGLNQFGWGNKISMEAALYWQLNPWQSDEGTFYVYTPGLTLSNTGIKLTPDTNWHSFSITADFVNLKWVSATIDGQTADISSLPLLPIQHTDWANEQVLTYTAEAEPAWPGASCSYITTWNLYFKNTSLTFH